jgi:hypothetical protein
MAIEFITGKDVERLNDQELSACLDAETNQHLVPPMTTSVALDQCAVQP